MTINEKKRKDITEAFRFIAYILFFIFGCIQLISGERVEGLLYFIFARVWFYDEWQDRGAK